jgi:chromosomal replication initiator protein
MEEIRTPEEIWKIALGELQIKVSGPNFRTWFGKTIGLSYQDHAFIVGVPSSWVAEYLEKNQYSTIQEVLIGLTCQDVRIVFSVNGKAYHQSTDNKGAGSQPSNSTGLDPSLTFATFFGAKEKNGALYDALTVAHSPGQIYNPLFIHGGPGTGKTTLLHSIGNAGVEKGIANIIYVPASDFCREYTRVSNSQDFNERLDFIDKYKNASWLLIDDIQRITAESEKTWGALFDIMNSLIGNHRQIVIVSDEPPQKMKYLQERIISRFSMGQVTRAVAPDYETRFQILESKAIEAGLSVPPDVISFIARNMQGDVRLLNGALNKLKSLSGREIPLTVAVVEKDFEDIISPSGDITPNKIVAAVAAIFKLTESDVKSGSTKIIMEVAREVAMFFIREELGYPFTEIGRIFGGCRPRDVNNACHAVKKYLKLKGSSQYELLSENVPKIDFLLHPDRKDSGYEENTEEIKTEEIKQKEQQQTTLKM